MATCDYIVLTVEYAQHAPHLPWSFIAVSTLLSLQSIPVVVVNIGADTDIGADTGVDADTGVALILLEIDYGTGCEANTNGWSLTLADKYIATNY